MVFLPSTTKRRSCKPTPLQLHVVGVKLSFLDLPFPGEIYGVNNYPTLNYHTSCIPSQDKGESTCCQMRGLLRTNWSWSVIFFPYQRTSKPLYCNSVLTPRVFLSEWTQVLYTVYYNYFLLSITKQCFWWTKVSRTPGTFSFENLHP